MDIVLPVWALLGFPYGGRKVFTAHLSNLYGFFLMAALPLSVALILVLFANLESVRSVITSMALIKILNRTCLRILIPAVLHLSQVSRWSATYLLLPSETDHPAIFFNPSFQTVMT